MTNLEEDHIEDMKSKRVRVEKHLQNLFEI